MALHGRDYDSAGFHQATKNWIYNRHETDPNSFQIGPLVETDSGPYNSSNEFYSEYPLALGRHLTRNGVKVDGQQELIELFRSLAATLPAQPQTADFGLANFDLNPNNVLVDREFNVLAVIDWDSVIAVPDAALYRIPFLMGVSCAIPGQDSTHPAVIKREELGFQFTEAVAAVGEEKRKDGQALFQFTKAGFYSKEALAFQSLIAVQMRQDWVNEEWIHGLKWLQKHDEGATKQSYLGE